MVWNTSSVTLAVELLGAIARLNALGDLERVRIQRYRIIVRSRGLVRQVTCISILSLITQLDYVLQLGGQDAVDSILRSEIVCRNLVCHEESVRRLIAK